MIILMLSNVSVRHDILKDEKYKFLFSVEEVNRLVLDGMPFRDAYKKVGQDIEKGEFSPIGTVNHTHEGSIGNLNLIEIQENMQKVLKSFEFGKFEVAIENLLRG